MHTEATQVHNADQDKTVSTVPSHYRPAYDTSHEEGMCTWPLSSSEYAQANESITTARNSWKVM